MLGDDDLAAVDRQLARSDAALAAGYPGDPGTRQPVHTLYVAADLVRPGTARDSGAAALAALAEHAPDAAALAAATGLGAAATEDAWARVVAKLEREPVEDLRVDLEDGYGIRADADEDRDAVAAVLAVAGDAQAPPWWGVRVKSLEPATRRRGLRTLDLVVAALAERGPMPAGFLVTLPKVTSVEQVVAMGRVCERLEAAHGLPAGALALEVQVETPQAVLGADGTATVARIVHAGAGRVRSLHYGTYDYSAALGVAAAQQALDHPVADHAKAVLQVAAAGTGVRLVDGSTNVLPVGDRATVHAAWALHARLVRRSLERAYYQGWDLHPAQLVTRYLATYAFYREGLEAAAARLGSWLGRRAGGILDEPATARALAGYLVRGLHCGALDEAEVVVATGRHRAELEELAR